MTRRTLQLLTCLGFVGTIAAVAIVPCYPLSVLAVWKDTVDNPFSLSADLRAIRDFFGPLLSFAVADEVTQFWGSLIAFVHLGWMVLLWAYLREKGAEGGKFLRVSLRIGIAGHLVGLWGNVFDYWRLAGVTSPLHHTSWLVTNLGIAIDMVGWLVLGIALVRANKGDRPAGWLFIGGFLGVPALYMSFSVVGYYPSMTWILLSAGMLVIWLLGAAGFGLLGRTLWRAARAKTA